MNEELIEEGIVVKSENGYADIILLTKESCEECSAQIICKPKDDSSRILNIKNTCGAQKGDKVTISVQGKTLLKAAFNLYLYPLLLLISGIILGLNIFANSNLTELYAFLLGCLCASIYYYIIIKLCAKLNSTQPIINKII